MATAKLIQAHAALLASLDVEIEQASDPAVYEASAPRVSGWSVKDHLEHLSIAHGGIIRWIERACDQDPELETGGSPSLVGWIVLLAGAFPRGRGKAPERTLPTGADAVELADSLRDTLEAQELVCYATLQLQTQKIINLVRLRVTPAATP